MGRVRRGLHMKSTPLQPRHTSIEVKSRQTRQMALMPTRPPVHSISWQIARENKATERAHQSVDTPSMATVYLSVCVRPSHCCCCCCCCSLLLSVRITVDRASPVSLAWSFSVLASSRGPTPRLHAAARSVPNFVPSLDCDSARSVVLYVCLLQRVCVLNTVTVL